MPEQNWFPDEISGIGIKQVRRVHSLKITDGWWQLHVTGAKPYEIRRNDRGFTAGDVIRFTDLLGNYRGRARITHVLTSVDGLEDGYAVLTVERLLSFEAWKDLPERGCSDG